MSNKPSPTKRPEFRNIAISDITSYRLPMAGIASILHRISGVLMFLLLPLVAWLFDRALTSQASYDQIAACFGGTFGWFYKLVVLGLIWAFFHHLLTGIRFLIMDACHETVSKSWGRTSAQISTTLGVVVALVLGAKLFGLY